MSHKADTVFADAEYVVPVKIGTPGVTLDLDFDTVSNPEPNPNARRTFRVSAPTHLHGKPPPKAPKPLVFCANGKALSQGLFRRTANPPHSPVKKLEHEQEEDVLGTEYPSEFDHSGHQTSEFVPSQ
ncbi:hypothetical protein DFH08DRAFT_962210 [Mycena albidolilacea]|uniref:Uncharacterized protein n=1 Tax=Mycena albidolilacea TaxID=1033008 RepID=A0AAD6ZYF9_9AGAR|nr:hypothetical protein DFH08DRAFT_962210 [Mycena albidolilacea]